MGHLSCRQGALETARLVIDTAVAALAGAVAGAALAGAALLHLVAAVEEAGPVAWAAVHFDQAAPPHGQVHNVVLMQPAPQSRMACSLPLEQRTTTPGGANQEETLPGYS